LHIEQGSTVFGSGTNLGERNGDRKKQQGRRTRGIKGNNVYKNSGTTIDGDEVPFDTPVPPGARVRRGRINVRRFLVTPRPWVPISDDVAIYGLHLAAKTFLSRLNPANHNVNPAGAPPGAVPADANALALLGSHMNEQLAAVQEGGAAGVTNINPYQYQGTAAVAFPPQPQPMQPTTGAGGAAKIVPITSATRFIEAISNIYPELTYFTSQRDVDSFNAYRRLMGSMLSVFWILRDGYHEFVRPQNVNEALSPQSWRQIQDWFGEVGYVLGFYKIYVKLFHRLYRKLSREK
jgi:hypothetical protein